MKRCFKFIIPFLAISVGVMSCKEEEEIFNYTVSFYSEQEMLHYESVTGGQVIEKPVDPTKDYYEFVGWYIDQELNTPYDFTQPVTTNLSLYAKFTRRIYFVNFYNGEEIFTTSEVPNGERVYFPATIPTREHFDFNGWYVDEALTTLYDFEQTVTSDFNLYAGYVHHVYTVSFYNSTEVVSTDKVESGSATSIPEVEPTKPNYDFGGWYADEGLTIPYDFSTPVYSDLSIYAGFTPHVFFSDFDRRFVPNFSPFEASGPLYSTDVNPTLIFKCQSFEIEPYFNRDYLMLYGALSDLEIETVGVNGKIVTIKTKGAVKEGVGYVAFSKESTVQNEYFITTFNIMKRAVEIEPSSISINSGKKEIKFKTYIYGDTLKNKTGLTPEEYLERVTDKTYDYFHISNTDKFTLKVEGVTADFNAVAFSITCVDEINIDTVNALKAATITIDSAAFTNAIGFSGNVDLTDPSSTTTIEIAQESINCYKGRYQIHLNNARWSKDFKNNIDTMLSGGHNRNLMLRLDGQDVEVNSLVIEDNQTASGTFTVNTEVVSDGVMKVDFSHIIISDELKIKIATSLFSGDVVAIPMEETNFVVSADLTKESTVKTEKQKYEGVKSVIEELAFDNSNDKLDNLVDTATNLGLIGYGLYSEDMSMTKSGLGNLLNIDSLKDPTVRILSSLQDIMDELKVIEEKLDEISAQIEDVEEELEAIGQQSILDNYLNSRTMFNQFITDYYVPLTNLISSYTTAYFGYFYDLAMQSYQKNKSTDLFINVYYDVDGNLAYPNKYGTHSLDGKIIDENRTLVVPVYELTAALCGIRANQDHAYIGIEDDFIADFYHRSGYEAEVLNDIIDTIRFNAMISYFDSADRISNYINTFFTFCQALTDTQIVKTDENRFTPLDAYRVMLSSVYNFGFEIEPDLNIAVIKLASTYHVCASLFKFANFINNGLPEKDRFKEIDRDVKKELTSERFYKHNIDGYVYSYVCDSYIDARTNAYSIYFTGHVLFTMSGTYINDAEFWISENVRNDFDKSKKMSEFSSITENDLDLMMLKVKVANNLKSTNYSFKEYLGAIGVIPANLYDKTKGVVLGINGLVKSDDTEDLKFTDKLTKVAGEEEDFPNKATFEKINDERESWQIDARLAIKGKFYNFADGKKYTGLAGMAFHTWAPKTMGWDWFYVYGEEYINDLYPDQIDDPLYLEVASYYVNFKPVTIN